VLALNVPTMSNGRTPEQNVAFYKEAMRRIDELPGVNRVAVGTVVPWRDANSFGPGFEFWADGLESAPGQENPRANFRTVSPGFFAALGVPLLAGRDFDDNDRRDRELVVIVSRSLAERLFPGREALGRGLVWTDPVMKFIDVSTKPRRIVGIAPDVGRRARGARPHLDRVHTLRAAGALGRPALRPRERRSLHPRARRHPHRP
jgi:hypothetical protein